ncbi:class I SAM-dependent methyltransferase [Mycolicibacterium pulveris]|uniref:class I SAM-dependent methyltransferase n=1 Tax=Mycolicibacterium pulveris TaxID=36813 RepID=UPI003CFAF167
MLKDTLSLQAAARDEVERLRASRPFDDEPSDIARAHHLRTATTQVRIPGLWLEFGVSIGTSTATLAECAEAADTRLYGFDSFEGLPEEWVVSDDEVWSRGAFGGRPSEVPDNVELVVGLFQDTLPGFLEAHPGPVAFAHIDCDLYSSTHCVFEAIRERLAVGTVLVFDELFNYDRYHEHEMRALIELGEAGVRWRYLGHVPARYAASVILTEVP